MTGIVQPMIRPLVLMALALVLAGCATQAPVRGVTERLSAPYVEAQHQYHFAAGSAALSGAERAGIHKFLTSLALREGDAVLVAIPTSGSAVVDAGRKRTMGAALALVPSRVSFAMEESFATRPLQPRQTGLIRVARAKGIKVDCEIDVERLGCANAINLAVMIHEPGDVLFPARLARTAQQ